jgi:4'-phosphopantetheinyl transferase
VNANAALLSRHDEEGVASTAALPGVTVHVWRASPRTAEHRSCALVAAHLGCPAREVSVARGPYGRPRVFRSGREVPRVWLSLSSAGPWRALAVTSTGPVGVDVEAVPHSAVPPTASWCTADELRALAAWPDDLLPRGTARLWTVKEAALKALGTGLAVDPYRIGAGGLDGVPVVTSFDGRSVGGWETAPVPVPEGYVGTVALRRLTGGAR